MNVAELVGVVFLRPVWLWLAIPLLVALGWTWWRADHDGDPWGRVIDAPLLRHLVALPSVSARRRWPLFSAVLAALLALLALAGPAIPGAPATWRSTAARVIVVDLSPAMVEPLAGGETAVDVARRALSDVLAGMPSGEVALVVYGEEPYLAVPLTTDRVLVAALLPELDPVVIPVPGARPERALAMAARALLPRGGGEIVWLAGPRWSGAALPGALDAALTVVGAAGTAGADGAVRVSLVHLVASADAKAQAWAASRRGVYVPYHQAGPASLDPLLATLRERPVRNVSVEDGRRDVGWMLLFPLLPLVALGFRRGGVLAWCPAVWVLGGLLLAQGPPALAAESGPAELATQADREAWAHVRRQAWPEAARRFADPRWRAAAQYRAGDFAAASDTLAGLQDAASLYNRGNALAKSGRIAEAIAAYEASLSVREHPDTRFNLDLLRRQKPPPTGASGVPPPPPPAAAPAEAEAARVAEQWLGSVPDEPQKLLARRLRAEQTRRQAGQVARPW